MFRLHSHVHKMHFPDIINSLSTATTKKGLHIKHHEHILPPLHCVYSLMEKHHFFFCSCSTMRLCAILWGKNIFIGNRRESSWWCCSHGAKQRKSLQCCSLRGYCKINSTRLQQHLEAIFLSEISS